MALQRITYEDKLALLAQNQIADVNKISDTDMNEIKTVVNAIASATDTNVTDINSLKNKISTLESNTSVASIIDIVYPIGSIYISYDSTNPGTRWAGTTWIREAEGRCIIGLGTGYPTVGATGGSTTVDLSHTHTSAAHTHSINSHTHSTGNHTLTTNEIPSHAHGINWNTFYNGYSFLNAQFAGQGGNWTGDNQFAIAGARNMPGVTGPYALNKANFMALPSIGNSGGSQGHNHGNTGGTSLTTNSTTPGKTGSALSSTQNIMQPYVVMYIWRRTK